MELLSINWITILEESVSGLVVGLIIGAIGFLIWKWQFHYQKKLETYSEFIPYFYKFCTYIEDEFDQTHTKEYRAEVSSEILNIIYPLALKFKVYFGDKYYRNFSSLLTIYTILLEDGKSNLTKTEFNNLIQERKDIISNAIKQK
jgi:hypothetical protein